MAIIKTHKLTKTYGRARGICELDLTVDEGEFFGIIGPNGAGKSTTIRTLLGLIAPTSGSAEIFGRDITKERQAILRDIGYLPSEAIFYSGMKVKDILRFSAELRGCDCRRECERLAEELQLDVSRKVDELSFGNRKKVGIVCALQHEPSLLILDEPTSGLDPFSRDELLEIFLKLRDEGVAVFFSTHIISDIEKCADNIVYISGGRIVAAMPKDGFLQRYSQAGETLEETFLRMERGDGHA